jgi:hypothetical protein
VGKTRLLAEVTGTLDAVVLRGGCLPLGATGLPFSPIVEVLRDLAGDGPGPGGPAPRRPTRCPRCWPGWCPACPPGPRPDRRARPSCSRPSSACSSAWPPPAPSSSSLRTSTGLTARPASSWPSWPTPCGPSGCVVATYRADDLHRQHPLRPLLAELRRNGRVRRVELAPFAAAEVAEYLAAATGSRPSPNTVAAVVDRTEGNAYFIEELIAADGLGGRPLPESFRIGPPPRSRRPCAGHDPPKAGPSIGQPTYFPDQPSGRQELIRFS